MRPIHWTSKSHGSPFTNQSFRCSGIYSLAFRMRDVVSRIFAIFDSVPLVFDVGIQQKKSRERSVGSSITNDTLMNNEECKVNRKVFKRKSKVYQFFSRFS